MNRNHLLFGLVLGMIVPLIGILLFYIIKYMPNNISLSDFMYMVASNHYIIPKVISLGLLACIPLITYFKNRKLYNTLKGIFVAIILYGLIAVLYKFNIL